MLLKQILGSHCCAAQPCPRPWLMAPSQQLCSLQVFTKGTVPCMLDSRLCRDALLSQHSMLLLSQQVRLPCPTFSSAVQLVMQAANLLTPLLMNAALQHQRTSARLRPIP